MATRHLAKLPPAQKPAPVPRSSLLDPYDATIRSLLSDTPELKTAMLEVMRTGHVGVEYVEYVLRHKRKLAPGFTPLKLGNPALDDITLREPDLSIYDRRVLTRDPGEPSASDP